MICVDARFVRYSRLLAVAAMVGGCGGGDAPPQSEVIRSVKTLVISDNAATISREFPGKVRASQSAELSFRISGPLIEFSATPGQQVETGEVLANIDPRDFQTRVDNVESTLKEAGAQLSAMTAGAREEDIKVLEANVASAEATSQEATAQYDRLSALLEEGVGTKAEVDSQLKVRDVAQANLDKAEQNLKSGRAGARQEDVDAMNARIDGLTAQRRDAQAKLDDTNLKAPFPGVIAKTYVENFEDVQAKQPILSLQDDSAIEIVINISESAMARGDRTLTIAELAESLDARVRFTSVSNDEYKVTLKDYETEADPVTQTFAVAFIMTPPDGINIRPGMNAVIAAYGKPADAGIDSSISVPLSAVFADVNGGENVWKVDPGTMKVSAVRVETGTMAGDSVAILSGLEVDDIVATSAANSLREGMKIQSLTSLNEGSAE